MNQDRRLIFLALKEIETKKSWSNLVLNKVLKDCQFPAFARELIYGILRNTILLDENINRYLKKTNIKTNERILLRMGFYQLAKMNSVAEYAAINETVNLAKAFIKGKEGFINGVLRNFLREGKNLISPQFDENLPKEELIKALSIAYSCKEWIVSLWLSSYGYEKTVSMLENSLKPAPLVLRCNILKNSKENLKKALEEEGFLIEDGILANTALHCRGQNLLNSSLFKKGHFSVQGETSQFAIQLLKPKKGEVLLDLCAAPGGKACGAAEAMEDLGNITAFDIYESRCDLIKAQAKRLDLKSIKTFTNDSSIFMPEWKEQADCILCDVPCSGLGVMRQKPEIKLLEKPKDFEELPVLQRKILENAFLYLKTKGRLLYATCTVNPAENHLLTEAFLKEKTQLSVVFEKQFFPQEEGIDGFYVCLMRKN